MAHIAHGKKARNISFEQEWIPVERPSPGTLPVANQVGTCEQETALVALDNVRQPIRLWQCANKNKHCARRDALCLAGVSTEHGNLFQVRFAMRLGYAGMGPQLNVWRFFHLVDQIL